MLARQIKADLTLHGGQQFDLRPLLEHLLDQRQIRKVVLDVENLAIRGLGTRSATVAVFLTQRKLLQRRLSPGKFNPEGAAVANCAFEADGTAHGLHQALRKREAEAGSLHIRLFGTKTLEWCKQPLEFFIRNSRAGVVHKNPHVMPAVGALADGNGS